MLFPQKFTITLWMCASILLIFGVTIAASGQNAQGTMLGHVVDSTGAVVTGAHIDVQNVNTGVVHSFTTTRSGDYVIPNLNPGNHTVHVAAPGFKDASSTGLILEVDQTLRQNFTLAVGSATETTTVNALAQMLQTDNPTNG